MERKKYPIGPEFYELYEEIGQGVSASVHRALCIPYNEIVAIKILDFERDKSDLNNISREAQTMILVDHPNVLKAHCSFVSDHNLWVVMPYMDGGSCLHILKAAYPDGFEEAVIATILREVLKGLEYLHHHGHIHRDVKAGNILVDARGGIKLGDFGVSACLFDSGDRQRTRNTFVGTPCWMAPEVMEQLHGYDFKADMWSVGITALELAHGHAPFSKYPPMKVLLMTLQNAPPGLDYERDKKFSKSFKQMIAMCLVKEPSKRPSAHKLLKHPFFKQARSNDYIARTILEGLPSLGERLKALKEKDADMLAQKKMPDGKKEEISQNEYKRGISGWNFNIDDMKAQASLIQDVEETIPDKDQVNNSSSLFGLDMQSQRPLSTTSQCLKDDIPDTEDHDAAQNRPVSLPLADISVKNPRGGSVQFEVDVGVAGSSDGHHTSQDSLQHHDYPAENELESEIIGRHLEGVAIHSPHWGGGLSGTNLQEELALPFYGGESDKQHTQEQNRVNCNGVVVPQSVDDNAFETLSRASKSSASNNEDVEEKSKGPIVQQRGRFKVTSENVDLEKVLPSPALQKSHSVQVFSQLPANSLPFDATPSNHLCNSLYLQLHSILQSNIHQRDDILSLMKLLSNAGDYTGLANHSTDGGSNPVCNTMEKSLLESAHDREKELTQELTELQWRLICIQDELQRSKMKNVQFQE